MPARHGGKRSTTMDTNEAMNTAVTSPEGQLWETPTFVEIRMDAEVGSYQDDFDGEDWH
jgi:hypothetical protein